ncbi:Transcription elongation factor SPT4 [Labeo rohita]|uniref:Transcription elongation factor SPT4 n=1 Tax=Labeo rohita TaxID=84645 RepID=A0ABQ8MQE3_LABRO|nr:Transcription elongation factor SPT4 [Labeo rohita]
MSLDTVPKDLRHLRACLLCSLVKTIDQFEYDGCDNCESYLQMKGNREMVYECTSSSFDGVIAMMSPEDSWVAKWQRIGVVRELKSRGVIYRSRDTACYCYDEPRGQLGGKMAKNRCGARAEEQRRHLQIQRHGC